MATKRLRDDCESISDQPESKRMRRTPSFTMVIRQATFAKSAQSFCIALEPLLRRVVQEELDRGLARPALALQR